ncbi:MAG: MaoC family dehydratase N-terminal domain-containing protein [Proteobacteria bacterium]|nr:MaoC family dehydratase N-terminal domain-containing protein [Pseudomonadota bacterium]
MTMLKSTSFDDLEIGSQGTFSKTLTERDIVLFGDTSGDINPLHFDEEYASSTMFKGRVAHGMWSAGLISTCIGTVMPGPGSIYLGQELAFKLPVRIGDPLTASVTVKEKNDRRKFVVIDCQVRNQHGKLVVCGDAKVMPPEVSAEVEAPRLPDIQIEHNPGDAWKH